MLANGSSAETYLCGGNNGYLGLALKDAYHAAIPITLPFAAPECLYDLTMSLSESLTDAL